MSEVPIPEQLRGFGESAARDGADTYATICLGIADNPAMERLLGAAPLAQRRPNLLLAAVHFLLLGGAAHPLADYYDTVRRYRHASGNADPARTHPPGGLVGAFRSFCLDYHDELVELIARRSTQTNEIGRCAALLPALCSIAERHGAGASLSLLDLGTSAGLNLLLDQYTYTYRQRSDGTTEIAGRPSAEVTLECTVRGDLADLPSLALPEIDARIGLDLLPIDPTTDDGALWLLACLWPDNLDRFARLQGALRIAATTPHPPMIRQGDMVDDLDRVAGTVDAGAPLVIFHSWVAAYLTAQRQAELYAAVRAVAESRPVHYLYAESPAETPGLPTPPPPDANPKGHLRTALVHVDLTEPAGSLLPVRLADLHPHGRWLQWWGA
jgi:hypothetical protein